MKSKEGFMRLTDLIRTRKAIWASAAILFACHTAVYAGGHCRSCCNPCPTMTGEFFGFYPTLWRPWPGTAWNVPSTTKPEAPAPKPMPILPEKNEPIPPPMKDKPQDLNPDDLGVWKQTSPYSPAPVVIRHSASR
jgi:hypothetical protein